MSDIDFLNVFVTIPFIILYRTLLHFFFKITSFQSTKIFNKDKLRDIGKIKNIFYIIYINVNLIFFFYILIFLFSYKGYSSYFF